VARLGQAFGCTVLGYDADASTYAQAPGVTETALDDLFARSDIVTLHAPLNAGTRHVASRERLSRMPMGAVVVNAARGGLVDEAALADLLRAGHLGGCALDVFEKEPPLADHPLFGLPNAVLTPHLGGSTAEAQERAALNAARAVRAFLAGESPPGRVV
jgi:phosphoglycerate dehydrogenase-like enzyme